MFFLLHLLQHLLGHITSMSSAIHDQKITGERPNKP